MLRMVLHALGFTAISECILSATDKHPYAILPGCASAETPQKNGHRFRGRSRAS